MNEWGESYRFFSSNLVGRWDSMKTRQAETRYKIIVRFRKSNIILTPVHSVTHVFKMSSCSNIQNAILCELIARTAGNKMSSKSVSKITIGCFKLMEWVVAGLRKRSFQRSQMKMNPMPVPLLCACHYTPIKQDNHPRIGDIITDAPEARNWRIENWILIPIPHVCRQFCCTPVISSQGTTTSKQIYIHINLNLLNPVS